MLDKRIKKTGLLSPMCGRFSVTATGAAIEQRFGARFHSEEAHRRWNVAPTNRTPVITGEEPSTIHQMHFGLIPRWAKDHKISFSTINARVETITEKPSFREAFAKRPCIVITDGYYEWIKEGKAKRPFRITNIDQSLMAFAGIWEVWMKGAQPIHSFSIITTGAYSKIAHLHHRMPIILPEEQERAWLNSTDLPITDRFKLLEPIPEGDLQYYEVSTAVNNVRNDSPELVQPLHAT